MKQAIYIFTDLDDSLFQTRRKCLSQTVLFDAATDRQGQILSFFTQQQKSLAKLLEQATLIPVTGRNSDALNRVCLPFSSYRVTSHGAMILQANGQPDPAWLEQLWSQQAYWLKLMETACTWVHRYIDDKGLDARCHILEDQGLPMYVSIKGSEQTIEVMAQGMSQIWNAEGATIHRNGHNMALLPSYASKEQAVSFLMQRLTESDALPLFMGIGDSTTDLPFLGLCDYALIPRRSQIGERLWI